MDGGRFSQIATPDDLYAYPANTFVAKFIGSPSMNFVPGKLAMNGATVQVRTEDGIEFDVSSYRFAAKPADGQKVMLGLRPELFHRPAEGSAAIPMQLNIIEPLGSSVLCYCSLGKTDIVASLNPSDIAGARTDEELKLAIDLSKISIFDEVSSLRL